MSMTVEETLTLLAKAAWILDHAVMEQLPPVGEDGKVDAGFVPGEPQLLLPYLEARLRPTARGVAKVGVSVRLWLLLLIVAVARGDASVAGMLKVAKDLPRDMQWQLGILAEHDGEVHELTRRQLDRITACFARHLDPDPSLSAVLRRERLEALLSVQRALHQSGHVLPHYGSSYAVDETGVWSWSKGHALPEDAPPVDPADEDANKAAEIRAKVDAGEEIDWEQIGEPDTSLDEDVAADGHPVEPSVASGALPRVKEKGPGRKRCWFARWGVKTHKSGRRCSYFGYALHLLLRVPDIDPKAKFDPDDEGGHHTGTKRWAEPLLVEDFELTAASTDLVEPTLGMVRRALARGHKVRDLIGDKHYSYKALHRWATRLWRLGVRPVLDLREDDHRPMDVDGAIWIDGSPHCGLPDHLRLLPRPGLTASKKQRDQHRELIEERQQYAGARKRTPWESGNTDCGTRWMCGGEAGKIGCHFVADSVQVATDAGLPIINPTEKTPWCGAATFGMRNGVHAKYHQEHYWGTLPWLRSWNRRTYVEGVFGNMKNYHTGNIHRGFTAFTGQALVTLVVTAAVIVYELREYESWFARATEHDPTNPLLPIYAAHPLHQRTPWQFGHTMLTKEQADELDARFAARLRHDPARQESSHAA